jgi:2-polyprenyl-3-methyl-5-hydroxy-6-metoxy-1,4-benzoquinol methylase
VQHRDSHLPVNGEGPAEAKFMHSMLGASRNSQVLEELSRRFGWGGCPKMLDVGGGHGLLGLEMAAKNWTVTVIDQDPAKTELLGPWLVRQSARPLPIEFLTMAMEELPECSLSTRLSAPHVITFFGSLLFARRERRPNILRACWKRLAPGGALLIHELVRSDPAEHLHERRFDRDELIDLIAENAAPPGFVSIRDGRPMDAFRPGLTALFVCKAVAD